MSTRHGLPPGSPSLETLQLLGVDLIDAFTQLAERHDVPRSVVVDAAEGFCVGVAVGAGETRREYLQRAAKLHDTITAQLAAQPVGQS